MTLRASARGSTYASRCLRARSRQPSRHLGAPLHSVQEFKAAIFLQIHSRCL